MILVVGALVAFFFLLVLVLLAVALVRRLIYFAALVVGVMLILPTIGQPEVTARLAVGSLLAVFGIVGILRRRWRRSQQLEGLAPGGRIIEHQPLPPPNYARDTARLSSADRSGWWRRTGAHARLICAFDILARHSRDARLAAGRSECLRFVQAYPVMIPDMASATLAAEIENDVPDMVDKFLALAPHITAPERSAAIDRMLTRLTALSNAANEAMRPTAEDLHTVFDQAVDRPYRRVKPNGLDSMDRDMGTSRR